LIGHLTDWPVGAISLALNVPPFAWAARSMGLRFGARSVLTTAALSLLLDWLPVAPVIPSDTTERLMLAGIFGGVLAGAGMGLIIRGNATTGGSELLARLIHKRYPIVAMSAVMFVIDAVVIIASGFVFDVLSAMFALISAFLMSYTTDFVVDGLSSSHAYLIISSKNTEIASTVLERMNRGATALYGRGAYSGNAREVLLCVVSRVETIQLRNIVAATDPGAFILSVRAQEVLGEGFTARRS